MKYLLIALLATAANAEVTRQIVGSGSDWHTACPNIGTVTGCSGEVTVIGYISATKWHFTFIIGPLDCSDGNRLSGVQRFSGYWDTSTYTTQMSIRIIGKGGAPDYHIRIDVKVDENGNVVFKERETCE